METKLDLRVSLEANLLEVIRSQAGSLLRFSLGKPPSQSVLIATTRETARKSTEQAIIEFISDLDPVLPLLSKITKTLRVAEFVEVGTAAAFGLELSASVLESMAERGIDLDVMFFLCSPHDDA